MQRETPSAHDALNEAGPPPAIYKDLCIDAVDPARLGRFWADVLGLTYLVDGDAAVLRGPTPRHTVWINRVPEAKYVKHRMHLDVNVTAIEPLVALGARVVDQGRFPWTVMRDPEGGEFCAFLHDELPGARFELVVDTAEDPGAARRIAAWWAGLLGARIRDADGYVFVDDIPGAPIGGIAFVPVPELKTVKNRIHLDVMCRDVDDLAGARLLRAPDDDIEWHVFADPDGNEFCAFVDPDAVQRVHAQR